MRTEEEPEKPLKTQVFTLFHVKYDVMTKIPDIQRKIEDALESLNGIQRAEPSPFFYTRLMARLEKGEKNVWETLSGVVSRPVVALSTLVLVLFFNALVLFKGTTHGAQQIPDYQELSMADEYNQVTAFFDIENIQP